MKKHYIAAAVVGVSMAAAGTIVFGASASSLAYEATPAAAAQASYLWGMGYTTLVSVVFLSSIGVLATKASRLRRKEYMAANGSMEGYSAYYTGALLASASHTDTSVIHTAQI